MVSLLDILQFLPPIYQLSYLVLPSLLWIVVALILKHMKVFVLALKFFLANHSLSAVRVGVLVEVVYLQTIDGHSYQDYKFLLLASS